MIGAESETANILETATIRTKTLPIPTKKGTVPHSVNFYFLSRILLKTKVPVWHESDPAKSL